MTNARAAVGHCHPQTVMPGQFEEIGFANEDGLLVLTVTWGMAGWLREKLGDAMLIDEHLGSDQCAVAGNTFGQCSRTSATESAPLEDPRSPSGILPRRTS